MTKPDRQDRQDRQNWHYWHLNLTFQVTCDWQLSQFLWCFLLAGREGATEKKCLGRGRGKATAKMCQGQGGAKQGINGTFIRENIAKIHFPMVFLWQLCSWIWVEIKYEDVLLKLKKCLWPKLLAGQGAHPWFYSSPLEDIFWRRLRMKITSSMMQTRLMSPPAMA